MKLKGGALINALFRLSSYGSKGQVNGRRICGVGRRNKEPSEAKGWRTIYELYAWKV